MAARNLLKLWLLLLGFCAALGLLGWAAGGLRSVSLFVFCGLLAAAAVYGYGDRALAGLLGARELLLAEAPAVHSTLARLAARLRVAAPRLYLLDDGYPRALVVGRGRTGPVLIVSRGLLSACPAAELEGVLAHELAHIRNRDVVVQSTAVLIALALVELSRVGGWLSRALLFVLGPTASAVVHLLLSPKRELAADRAAAEACDSPHGLADALLRLDQAGELLEFRASPATEPLYTVSPFGHDRLAALFETHPPVGERVARLRALDPHWRQKLRAA